MPSYPTVDYSLDRLRRAGWSVGDVAFGPDYTLIWLVTGSNGDNQIESRGRTRAEAYWRACCQAREVGMLAPPKPAAIMSGVARTFPRRTHQ